jgi:hypothetical protein
MGIIMAEEKRSDDVEKFLSEQKVLEDRKQALIDDLLKQREAAIAAFDEKLEKLGYRANSGKGRRSHHRKAAASAAEGTKPAAKPKA